MLLNQQWQGRVIQVSFALIQQGIHHIGGLSGGGQRQGMFPAGLQGVLAPLRLPAFQDTS